MDVENEALPFLSTGIGADKNGVQNPFTNCNVPAGVPEGEATVAVNVTLSPQYEGLPLDVMLVIRGTAFGVFMVCVCESRAVVFK